MITCVTFGTEVVMFMFSLQVEAFGVDTSSISGFTKLQSLAEEAKAEMTTTWTVL